LYLQEVLKTIYLYYSLSIKTLRHKADVLGVCRTMLFFPISALLSENQCSQYQLYGCAWFPENALAWEKISIVRQTPRSIWI